jgi:hypothetical protein
LIELEAKEHEALEKKYTIDDMNFSWEMGYESRKQQELGEEIS